jgi:hypothetical protein
MARYMLFEKTRSFDYKFRGTVEASNGNMAIKKARGKGFTISSKAIIIAIPSSQFMKYQMNPKKTKGKMGIVTNWIKR